MSTIAVIDFETTGISPNMGDRATEVAIVLLEDGQVVDRYQSLMNAGVRVSSFITQFTGITNEMVQAAPPAEQVMREAARFVGGSPMVAHTQPLTKSSGRPSWRVAEKMRHTLLPAPCCCRAACTRKRPTTSWARWRRCTICPRQAGPIGRWPMPRWLRICWRRCSTT